MDKQRHFHFWYVGAAFLAFQGWWQERYGVAVIP